MEEYKLNPEGFLPVKQKVLKIGLIKMVGFIILITVLSFSFADGNPPSNTIRDVFILFGSLFLVNDLLKIIRQIRKMQKEWASYTLKLEDNRLIKTQIGHPDVEINANEINKIMELPNSGLSVQTGSPDKYLFIPSTINNYFGLRQNLLQYQTIEVNPLSTDAGITSNLIFHKRGLKTFVKTLAAGFGTIVALYLGFIILVLLISHIDYKEGNSSI